MLLNFAACAAYALTALASPLVLHEKRERPLQHVFDRQRLESDTVLPMRIALTQNTEALKAAEASLLDISNPESPNYGNHWSEDDVIQAFKPSDEAVSSVLDWLSTHGIKDVTHTGNKQWLAFNLPAGKAEELFQTKYYRHATRSGKSVAASDSYYLPQHLQAHIDFVKPAVAPVYVASRTTSSPSAVSSLPPAGSGIIPPILNRRPKPVTLHPDQCLGEKNCSFCASPQCIRTAYGIPATDLSTPVSKNNSLGIFEDVVLYYLPDLDKEWENFTDIPQGTYPILQSVDGGLGYDPLKRHSGFKWQQVEGGEADLDIEIAQPIIYPQNITLWSVNDEYYAKHEEIDGYPEGLFNTWFDALDGSYCTSCYDGVCGDSPWDEKYPDEHKGGYKGKLQCGVYKPTNVISISYGLLDLTWPFNYQRRQCNELMKLSLRGSTIFIASGDTGIGECSKKANGEEFFDPFGTNDCPWQTAVGATMIPPGSNAGDEEVAADVEKYGFTSGGGFSLIFDRPSWQNEAVETYYKEAPPPFGYFTNGHYNASGKYNRNGRGYPDVSALGVNIGFWNAGTLQQGDGTSCAAPILGGLFNRIVEERLRAGKKPLGFINPAIYKNPQLFNDVTKGSNNGCARKKGFTPGFKTAKGWDPVTGLGTPNYPKLLEYFMSLP